MKIMKRFLGMLSGLTLATTGVSPVVAMTSNVVNQEYVQSISAGSIISTFNVTGDWGNITDSNAPSWAQGSNNGDYTSVFGKEVKKNTWNQRGEVSVSFVVDFNKIGGNYTNSNKYYNLNSLSQTKLVVKTQAGQPAHNKNNGWPEQDETFDILQLINDGVQYKTNGREYDWPKWAHFSSTIRTIWSSDKTSMRVVWEAKDLFLKASKWTDGLFFRLDLVNLGTTINKK